AMPGSFGPGRPSLPPKVRAETQEWAARAVRPIPKRTPAGIRISPGWKRLRATRPSQPAEIIQIHDGRCWLQNLLLAPGDKRSVPLLWRIDQEFTAASGHQGTRRIAFRDFEQLERCGEIAVDIQVQRLLIAHDVLRSRGFALFPEKLVHLHTLTLSFHEDAVELAELEVVEHAAVNRLADDDRGPVLLVQAFEARGEVHTVTDRRVVESFRG